MAESPFKITQSDDGLSVRCEFDAHYVSDEDAQRIMSYVNELQDENARLRSCLSDDAENAKMIMAENAKLRELVKDALINLSAWMGDGHPEWMVEAARELGIEVVE